MYGIMDIAGNATYDAATKNWGVEYKMPTKAQWDELNNSDYTTWTWTTKNGVKGCVVTSKSNGNSIFLAAAGYRDGTNNDFAGSVGCYWSSSLNENNYPHNAWRMYFVSSNFHDMYGDGHRNYGQQVRAVKAGAVTAVEEASKDEAKVSPKGVWTINGAYVGEKADNLSTGLYVIDGKKSLVK